MKHALENTTNPVVNPVMIGTPQLKLALNVRAHINILVLELDILEAVVLLVVVCIKVAIANQAILGQVAFVAILISMIAAEHVNHQMARRSMVYINHVAVLVDTSVMEHQIKN